MPYSREQIKAMIQEAAWDIGVPPEIALAQAKRESGFNPGAKGLDGERGLMQPLPSTWASVMPGVSFDAAFDPATNLQFWQRYFGSLLNQFGWDVAKALTAYNGGPGRVARGNPHPAAVDYARAILRDAGWGDVAASPGLYPTSTNGADVGSGNPAEDNAGSGKPDDNFWPIAIVLIGAILFFS